MQLTYTPSQEDYIDAQHVHAWRKYSPILAQVQKIFEPILGLLLLGLAYVLFQQHESGALILVEVMLGLYALLRRPLIAPWIYRRAYRRRHIEPAQPLQLEFTADHIHLLSAGRSDGTINWTVVRGYLDSSKTILLYTAPGLFLYVPKRVLSEDQHQELLGLLRQHDVASTYPR